MSRDLMDETYYISHGGKIPVRWTAPEVRTTNHTLIDIFCCCCCYRRSITRSTRQPVMCGALVVSCTRYGVWGTNHLKLSLTIKWARILYSLTVSIPHRQSRRLMKDTDWPLPLGPPGQFTSSWWNVGECFLFIIFAVNEAKLKP